MHHVSPFAVLCLTLDNSYIHLSCDYSTTCGDLMHIFADYVYCLGIGLLLVNVHVEFITGMINIFL